MGWNKGNQRTIAARTIGAMTAGLLFAAVAIAVAEPASAVTCSWGATDNYLSHWASTESWSGCSVVWAQHRYTPPGTSIVVYNYDSDPIYARTTAAAVMTAGYHGGS